MRQKKLNKIYVIAGEASGDYLGAKIFNSLKKIVDFNLYGIGGALLKKEGLDSLFPYSNINLMGFAEVVPKIFRLKNLINQTIKDIIKVNPDILITIDSPGFTFRVASEIKKLCPDIKLIHVVAPSVWAYKPNRAIKYAKIYDHLLCLLPFEPKYFEIHKLKTSFIGHPIFEQDFYKKSVNLKNEYFSKGKLIGVTPGSRVGEIEKHMPIIAEALEKISLIRKIKVIFIQNDDSKIQLITKYLKSAKFEYGFSTDRLKIFAACDGILAKSGTNTLEIAASGTSFIVGYKVNLISYYLIKFMIKIKFVCLINIIANRELIPEYLQTEFNPDNLADALINILDSKKSNSQTAQIKDILKNLGLNADSKPSEKAAEIIKSYLEA